MQRYRYIYRIIQGFVIFVTFILLVLIFLPIWQYDKKGDYELKFSWIGGQTTTQGVDWITNYYKMDRDNNADLLFYRDVKAVTKGNAKQLLGKAVIFEQLFSQESMDAESQKWLEYLTGASYSGFWGKTYQDLSDRQMVPKYLISQYEKVSAKKWDFRGEGIVITDGSQVIVMRLGEDYEKPMSFEFESKTMPYYGYFEITSGSEQIAEFSLNLTNKGKGIYEKLNLPASFPAIYKIDRNLYDGYYFAGDFSQLKIKEPYAYESMPWLLEHKGIYERYNNEEVFWKGYYPLVSKMITSLEARKRSGQPLVAKNVTNQGDFFADSERIYLQDGNEKNQFFIKGVNLGAALPGKAFTEFPQDKAIYSKWLTQVASLDLNTVRVYTLLPPVFYQAFYEYNRSHEKEPLYLLQEIWPEEKPVGNNYLNEAYNKAYKKEIEYVIRAVHGDIFIPTRSFRSSGMYAYDVSDYLIGYLVGRELEPEEVLSTDEQNNGYHYDGNYIYSEPEASPTESWLAESCDYALLLEDELYQNNPLAAIVSWPTLDPLEHNSEWNLSGNKALQYNDSAVVNINHIGINREKVNGFFGAYHIYPNYPDFMNNDIAYNSYQDDQGRFRYGGYLEAFMSQHKKYPALVAEYGLSTSQATAHYSPDGYHHGGLSEKEQAQGIIRMTKSIVKEGYTGAVIFEWMDEWMKKTWTTEFYMIPYNRHMMWHNVIDPEQNYGLLAYQADAPAMSTIYDQPADGNSLKRVAVGQDASYLNIELTFEDENAFTKPISLALSTYAMAGEMKTIWEFNLLLSPVSELLVNPGYDWVNGHYASIDAPLKSFKALLQKTNTENLTKEGTFTPEKQINLSKLKGMITIEDQKAWIRLPYGLIGFADPSSQKVLYDPKSFIPSSIDQIGVEPTPEIKIKVINGGKQEPEMTFKTIAWDDPDYIERQKDGWKALSEYFGQLN